LLQVKKLIGTGFYTNNLESRNLWAATELEKVRGISVLHTLFYNTKENTNYLLKGSLLPLNLTNSKHSINFFEDSYFWFLRRANTFLGSKNNSLESRYSRKSSTLLKTYENSKL
jgi:hypothetical protein